MTSQNFMEHPIFECTKKDMTPTPFAPKRLVQFQLFEKLTRAN